MPGSSSCLFAFLLGAISCWPAAAWQAAAAPVSNAPAVNPEKTALIRHILDASFTPAMREQVVTASLQPAANLMRMNPTYPPGLVDALEKNLRERFEVVDFGQFLIPIYAKDFTLDELKQIESFQTSTVGRKLLGLQPTMYGEMSAAIANWGRTAGAEAAREVLAQHPEYEQQMQDRQRQANQSAGPHAANVPTGSFDSPVMNIGNGVSAPTLLSKTEPHYSKAALKAKLEGSVLLSLIVDPQGMPRNIRVTRPLGMGLDEKAVEAVSLWRFKPGEKNGQPVATFAAVQVNFRLLQKGSGAQ